MTKFIVNNRTPSSNTGLRLPSLLEIFTSLFWLTSLTSSGKHSFWTMRTMAWTDWLSSSKVNGPVERATLPFAIHWQNRTIQVTRHCRSGHEPQLSISFFRPGWFCYSHQYNCHYDAFLHWQGEHLPRPALLGRCLGLLHILHLTSNLLFPKGNRVLSTTNID